MFYVHILWSYVKLTKVVELGFLIYEITIYDLVEYEITIYDLVE